MFALRRECELPHSSTCVLAVPRDADEAFEEAQYRFDRREYRAAAEAYASAVDAGHPDVPGPVNCFVHSSRSWRLP